MTDELQAYQIEIETYESVIPELEKIWKNVGENVNLGPRCYKIYRHPTDIIVLEDLKHAGFQVADRHSVLKMDEIDLVLQWLAKFHAASVVYVQKNGPLSKTFNKGMFSKEHIGKSWGTHYNQLYKTFRMFKWDEKITAKLDKFGDSIYEKCCEAMEVDEKDLNVLNHGDIWILNILFAERDSKKDINVIDFQFASWGSPVQDLWFLISTSMNIDDRIQNLKKIVNDYHKYLVQNLKKLNYSGHIPTEEEFYSNFIKRGIIALGITIESFAAICIDKGLQIDFETVKREDPEAIEIRKKIFMNDRFMKTAEKYLKFLDELGIFDN
ncbi:uncharacterized protein LOC134837618 [Culicoides brevitarsis]|uniref:uncharacterized protein LOC134837618 n=1 Tax=Culicoides brevitarsis TaxID=469753 RepID=UPI00307C0FFE